MHYILLIHFLQVGLTLLNYVSFCQLFSVKITVRSFYSRQEKNISTSFSQPIIVNPTLWICIVSED